MLLNKIKFFFFILISIFLFDLKIYATEYIIQPKAKSNEEIIDLLNKENFKPFLVHLNEKIFLRDKESEYIAKKMCTHGSDVIEEWKKFTLPKPSSFTFNSQQWKSMLARKGLFTFNPNLMQTPQAIIELQLNSPDSITVRKASGQGAQAIIMEVRWNSNGIGTLTEDTSPTISTPTTRNKENASSAESNLYKSTPINRVEVEYDITDIIENIRTHGLQKNFNNYLINSDGRITTVLFGGVLNASAISENEEGSILKTACIYHFCENPDEEVGDFFPVYSTPQNLLGAKLKEIAPIHINLIDRGVGDAVLEELIPYAHLIYGLSLEGNFFTDESLEIIADKFSELRYLDLKNNRLKNPHLDLLLSLSHLSTLELDHNKIAKAEIMKFQQQRRDCVVSS